MSPSCGSHTSATPPSRHDVTAPLGPLPALTDAVAGLDAIELVRVRLPLRTSIESAHGCESVRDVVLVRALGRDGVEGWGECSALEAPTYTGEYTDGAWAVLRDHLVPAGLAGRFGVVRGHPMAFTALEVALTDLQLRRDGRSLVDAVGMAPADLRGFAWTAVIGIDSIDGTLEAVGVARSRQASAVKLKIRPGWDVEPVRAVQQAHPDLPVSVDANGSYGWADQRRLVELAEVLAATGGAYIEQPFAADDLIGHVALARHLPVGIALDESIMAPGDAVAAVTGGAATSLNLKPARLGGIRACLRLSVALDGMDGDRRTSIFLGGLFETGVGRSTALAIAAATGLGIDRTDLGPSTHYFDDDLTEPIVLSADDGLAWPGSAPGVSAPPRPDRLAEVVVDRLLIRP
jgi:O-succinylbenzoate synthase